MWNFKQRKHSRASDKKQCNEIENAEIRNTKIKSKVHECVNFDPVKVQFCKNAIFEKSVCIFNNHRNLYALHAG